VWSSSHFLRARSGPARPGPWRARPLTARPRPALSSIPRGPMWLLTHLQDDPRRAVSGAHGSGGGCGVQRQVPERRDFYRSSRRAAASPAPHGGPPVRRRGVPLPLVVRHCRRTGIPPWRAHAPLPRARSPIIYRLAARPERSIQWRTRGGLEGLPPAPYGTCSHPLEEGALRTPRIGLGWPLASHYQGCTRVLSTATPV
jgi:hypothetical protein